MAQEVRNEGKNIRSSSPQAALRQIAGEAMEEQLNLFLAQHPDLELVTSHMSTLVSPAEPNAMPKTVEASIIIFCTLFYKD